MLEDLSSSPFNKHLYDDVVQQKDAPTMSQKSTNDIVVPNYWHTPLQQLGRWEVEGKAYAHFWNKAAFFPLHVNLNPSEDLEIGSCSGETANSSALAQFQSNKYDRPERKGRKKGQKHAFEISNLCTVLVSGW